MINEFFKSIFRTLGRIAAYILLGVLAYLILSWFGLPNVKAETIKGTSYTIQQINSSFGIGGTKYNSDIYFIGPSLGFQYLPTDSGSNIPIKSSEYYINLDFELAFQKNGAINQAPKPNIVILLGANGTSATCDGYEDLILISSQSTTNYFYRRYNYVCDNLVVNQDFDRIMIRVYNNSYATQTDPLYQIQIYETSFLDSNELSKDTDIIISNDDKNTNKVIENNNTNTDKIINSNNQTTTAVENLESAMLDDSDADLGFIEEIADWAPIDTPVTDIITLPINILNKTINSFGGTCQPYTINTGSLLGNYSWTFPCLNIGQYFTNYSYQGYNLWQLIDLMICMYMGYEILMLIISAYNSIANLEDPFSSLYQPKHVGYSMKHGEGRL